MCAYGRHVLPLVSETVTGSLHSLYSSSWSDRHVLLQTLGEFRLQGFLLCITFAQRMCVPLPVPLPSATSAASSTTV